MNVLVTLNTTTTVIFIVIEESGTQVSSLKTVDVKVHVQDSCSVIIALVTRSASKALNGSAVNTYGNLTQIFVTTNSFALTLFDGETILEFVT